MTKTHEHLPEENPTAMDRRGFLKLASAVAATLGLGSTFVPAIARALTGARPPVVWLHFSECTGCSESFLRATAPSVEEILFDTISLEYHETIMTAAGLKAEANLEDVVANHAGEFICIVEGSIPTAQGGMFGTIGGRTMLEIAQDVIPKAKATIAYGTCAAYGGLPAAGPNPTGAKGVFEAVGVSTVNIPGCPPHPLNLVSTIVSYLLDGTLPALDAKGRPTFAYGSTVHSKCSKDHGCLEGYHCKGRTTYNNCPQQKFNDGESWCIQVEHQCIGCSEPDFWNAGDFYNSMWTSMFSTYRSRAEHHPVNPAAFCTPCHGSSTYQSRRNSYGDSYALWAHNKHEIEGKGKITNLLDTNTGCASCHTAPGGTKANLDD